MKLATRLRRGRKRAWRRHRVQVLLWGIEKFERKLRRRGPNAVNNPLGQYILVDGEPYLVSPEEILDWAMWFEFGGVRVLCQTIIGKVMVSTVFLGLDHSFSRQGPPVLWETMVFGDDDDVSDWSSYQRRYRSRAEALRGHRQTVDEVRNGIILVLDEDS